MAESHELDDCDEEIAIRAIEVMSRKLFRVNEHIHDVDLETLVRLKEQRDLYASEGNREGLFNWIPSCLATMRAIYKDTIRSIDD